MGRAGGTNPSSAPNTSSGTATDSAATVARAAIRATAGNATNIAKTRTANSAWKDGSGSGHVASGPTQPMAAGAPYPMPAVMGSQASDSSATRRAMVEDPMLPVRTPTGRRSADVTPETRPVSAPLGEAFARALAVAAVGDPVGPAAGSWWNAWRGPRGPGRGRRTPSLGVRARSGAEGRVRSGSRGRSLAGSGLAGGGTFAARGDAAGRGAVRRASVSAAVRARAPVTDRVPSRRNTPRLGRSLSAWRK